MLPLPHQMRTPRIISTTPFVQLFPDQSHATTRLFFWATSMPELELITSHHVWKGVIGRHGLGNANSNGFRLLNLCSEFDFVIINTLFQQRNQRKATWQHPRSKHLHLIDYVTVRRCDIKDTTLTRATRGAECWADHR